MPARHSTVEVVRTSKDYLPPADGLRLTVLVEDSASMEKHDLTAKHGLSFLIEASVAGSSSRILMDAGPPQDVALCNADLTGADVRGLDAIVISHGHYDHAGGLLSVLERTRRGVAVVAHPLVFSPKFTLKPNLMFIGLDFAQGSVTAAGGALLLARNPVRISNSVVTTGEISRETAFEKTENFWTVRDERFVEDVMIDEQALVINVREKGLVVITGCSHSGIVNTVRHAQRMTGVNDVYAVIGGLHLARADDKRIKTSLDELLRIAPKAVYPCHCTGSKAIQRLLNSLGDGCKPIRTGDIIEL